MSLLTLDILLEISVTSNKQAQTLDLDISCHQAIMNESTEF